MVSHAGAGLLRELATETGLAGGVTRALLDTYRGFPVHLPGQVFADLAVAIADGADAVTGIEVLRDREALFGPVAAMPTAWRLLDRIDQVHLPRYGLTIRPGAWWERVDNASADHQCVHVAGCVF